MSLFHFVVGILFLGDVLLIPVMPVAAYARRANGDPPLPTDDRVMSSYADAYGKWTAKCEQVLSLYQRTLGDSVRDYLKNHTDLDLNVATRDNILRIIEAITTRYGSWTTEKGEANFDAMKAIPHFTSVATANRGLKLYQDLVDERITWHARHQFDDSSSRTWLLERMSSWSVLSHLRETISGSILGDDTITYASCLLKLSQKLHDLTLQDLASKRYICTAATVALPEPSELSVSFAGKSVCYNCGGVGHFCNDCTIPYCHHCGHGWVSCEVPEFHHNSLCPRSHWTPSTRRPAKRSAPSSASAGAYRQQQPLPPQYRSFRPQSLSSESQRETGRSQSGSYYGQPTHRGRSGRSAPSARGRSAYAPPPVRAHEASLEQSQGEWVSIWQPNANVVQCDSADSYHQSEEYDWLSDANEDEET